MRYRKILFLFLFTFFGLKAFAATFVVTSNADSGPGTLRDALTQAAANGSTTQDIIEFNLSDVSEAGRTITILTDLPNVSSNLIIDASTQPGVKFGVSDAKIKIEAQVSSSYSINNCLNIADQHDIEIYGLMLDVPQNLIHSTANFIIGIYGLASKNIIIGAPGKGNIIKNIGGGIVFESNYDETEETISENIKLSSNILGLNEDGETICDYGASNFSATRVRNLTIGGKTAAEGNVFSGQVNVDEGTYVNFNLKTGTLYVANNFFGTDYVGLNALPNYLVGTTLLISAFNLESVQISNNLFVARSDIGLQNINCFFKITGNKFGTDVTGTKVLGTFQFPLALGYCGGGGIVGGNDLGDGNIFSGAYQDGQASNSGGVVINIGSPTVEVTGNSFRCNNSTYPYQLLITGSTNYFVTIGSRAANSISGTATANSRVDLYYSLTCDHCEPEKQFSSVNADANGKWNYSGALSDYNIVASSTSDGTTSEFTALRFINQPTDIKIKMACGAKNGSITGFKTNTIAKYTWYDSSGNIVATTNNLVNAAPGKYYLIINNGYCSVSSDIFEIKDAGNQIDATNEKVNPASCGLPDGSITGIQSDPSSSIVWTNNNGQIVGYSTDLMNVPAGSYILTVTTADGSCTQKLSPITLKNTTGPNIDQSQAAIQPTNCGQSTGSITNLVVTGTGTLSYTWQNSQQQTVSTTKDLTGQPAGIYKLEVTDDSQCGPVYSTAITIPQTNGITLDESKAQTTVASCSKDNGSVTGIVVTGATQYQWTDANNKIVGTAADLQNAAPGDYTLTASNTFGCSATSKPYHVGQQPPTQFPVYQATIIATCTGQSNGSITVITDNLVSSARWVDSQGQTVGPNQAAITGIAAGTYQLFLTDVNGRENLYNSYNVPTIPQLQIVPGSEQVTNDQCGLKKGGVSNIQVTGGTPPYTYSWLDANNNVVSSSAALSGVGEGSYTLTVNDASGCGLVSAVYAVQNQNNTIPAPVASNVQLCSPGTALLQVSNPSSAYSYRLYSSETSTSPFDEQANGIFKITVNANTSFYVSQVSGECESTRTDVQVSVGITSVDIANTFTPNGDGINDYWAIKGIDNYPNATVQIFTRYGQKIFDSRGYPTPFGGTLNGKPLPAGVYYYIINLSTNCNLLSGSLTIIR